MADEDEDSTAKLPKDIKAMLSARLDGARTELGKLSNVELADVLLEELDRRRLDANGIPTNPEGLYWSVSVGIIAMLAPTSLPEDERPKVERLAAIGNGAHVRSVDLAADKIRWLSGLAEAAWNQPGDRAEVIAKTLAKRFGRPVSTDAVRAALKRRSAAGRAADLAIELGILPGPVTEKSLRQDALNNVSRALAKL